MAKKKKTSFGLPVRRVKMKIQEALRRFDLVMAAYMLIVTLCVIVGRCGEYELGNANLHGFALWFLLVPAYLFLEVLSFINWAGGFNWSCAGWEAELLGFCDILLGIAVWCGVRFRGAQKGLAFIRGAKTFVLIVVLWGVFQLCCCGALWLWQNGGFASFNRHLIRKSAAVNASQGENAAKTQK